jgi:amino acid permease
MEMNTNKKQYKLSLPHLIFGLVVLYGFAFWICNALGGDLLSNILCAFIPPILVIVYLVIDTWRKNKDKKNEK